MSPLPDRRQGRPMPGGAGGPASGGSGAPQSGGDQSWRWVFALLILAVIAVVIIPPLLSKPSVTTIGYQKFTKSILPEHQVQTANLNNDTGVITGKLKTGVNYSVSGPSPSTEAELSLLSNDVPQGNFKPNTPTQSAWSQWLPTILIIALMIGVFVWFSRRAQGQMSGIMSIGRSRARLYTTERPRTTFVDVAGYQGVKVEISEVVDFLKSPHRFRDIGAKIPKGILLVGPPGTGKTLLARAVAGEAGVPFLSVSGSDFMEMFVGVGASRVRDLFQTARKQAPAIIFVDEIDSIGRKRGAGLGGGHDEREQTLNQMLNEMDGFDPAEGVVIMAATNRPDILDPALLRPGRFDRQIVVPLPDLEERLPILQVHCKDKRVGPDVDLELVARGTPGMSGADLANLVNEAALHAVRRGSQQVEMRDFEAARDRVLMGQARESLVLSEAEKERVAFHEGGHAVLAYVLPHADPVHKVTILPTGMALGVTQQLPIEERHIYPREVIEDSLAVRMGGRAAELLVYGDLSTGASNDLVGNTEMARKMVREWGMSEELGPMAWGSQGMVFLGEDLLHSRDYSEDTARVVDSEVSRILRVQEERAIELLSRHRGGLDAVARGLLERETLDGAEVGKLVDTAYGKPVHEGAVTEVPHFAPTEDAGGTFPPPRGPLPAPNAGGGTEGEAPPGSAADQRDTTGPKAGSRTLPPPGAAESPSTAAATPGKDSGNGIPNGTAGSPGSPESPGSSDDAGNGGDEGPNGSVGEPEATGSSTHQHRG